MQADLFSDAYPDAPGWRKTDTSKAAALAMNPKAATVRLMVLEALKRRPMTSIEISEHLRLPYSTCQPRLSENAAKGLVEDSGKRGRSRDKSKSAIVWRLVTTGGD